MKDALAEAAVRVALERYSKQYNAGIGTGASDGPTPEQVSELHNELNAVLDEELAAAFSDAEKLRHPNGTEAAIPETADAVASKTEKDLARLLTLATESEQSGGTRRADSLHQV